MLPNGIRHRNVGNNPVAALNQGNHQPPVNQQTQAPPGQQPSLDWNTGSDVQPAARKAPQWEQDCIDKQHDLGDEHLATQHLGGHRLVDADNNVVVRAVHSCGTRMTFPLSYQATFIQDRNRAIADLREREDQLPGASADLSVALRELQDAGAGGASVRTMAALRDQTNPLQSHVTRLQNEIKDLRGDLPLLQERVSAGQNSVLRMLHGHVRAAHLDGFGQPAIRAVPVQQPAQQLAQQPALQRPFHEVLLLALDDRFGIFRIADLQREDGPFFATKLMLAAAPVVVLYQYALTDATVFQHIAVIGFYAATGLTIDAIRKYGSQ